MDEEHGKCSICGVEYTRWGNNAYPYPGRCCDTCNWTHVIPARLARLPFPQKPPTTTEEN